MSIVLSDERGQIYEGAAAIDQIGIVSGLSAPLARAGLEMVYLSTFHTDLILVRCMFKH